MPNSFELTPRGLIGQGSEGGTRISQAAATAASIISNWSFSFLKPNFSICFLTRAVLETILDLFW